MKSNSQMANTVIASAQYELISRHGSAGAEFLKGLRGVDYETGKIFDRSLLDISNYKVNTEYAEKNVKQQAGFSAEIASTSKKNAEAMINKSDSRFYRSEDLSGYGKNHTKVDIVEILGDQEITSQMKFVANTEKLLDNIAGGKGKHDLSRYLEVDKLEVPTEQVESMKAMCRDKIQNLSKKADRMELDGKTELAQECRRKIENYEKLESKISDSGVTTDEAINYRLNPRWETAKDIASVSHKAGIEGAKFGAAIGGSISLITNLIAVGSEEKEFSDALIDTTKATLVSAGVGYGTAFVGTSIKSVMQQSQHVAIRGLSKTGLPGMIVSLCLAAGKSIQQYANDEINEAQLMEEMGESVSTMITSSMFSMIGQIAIPIPILGGLIGGMVGYTLTNNFYFSFVNALKDKRIAKERRKIIEMNCAASMALAKLYQVEIKEKFEKKLQQLNFETEQLFSYIECENTSADEFCQHINKFSEFFGEQLPIKSMVELDAAMLSDEILKI